MNATSPTTDDRQLFASAGKLIAYRRRRAASRDQMRAILDAMATQARRSLGAAFTENDPLTDRAVALVVRSDERLPDDYDAMTPRPATDTVNRLIVEVLGRAVTIELTDAGVVRAFGDVPDLRLDTVKSVRIADGGEAAAYLIAGADDDRAQRTEIPFSDVLRQLVDAAVQDQLDFNRPEPAVQPPQSGSGAPQEAEPS